MSWMDFKTAQALKAQKLASTSLRTKTGVQKGTGETASIGVDAISVQKAIKAPKASRRVQGVNKEARMTFAPGRGQRLANARADTGTHRQTMVSAPDHILNAPKPQARASPQADASYASGRSCQAPSGSVSAAASQFAKMSVADKPSPPATTETCDDGYADETYYEEAYPEEVYNEASEEAYAEEGHYNEEGYAEEGYAEEAYAEEGYTEAGYAEAGYAEAGYAEEGYAEEGYAEEGYAEEGYAEEGYYEEGYAEEGYYEEGYEEGYYEEEYYE